MKKTIILTSFIVAGAFLVGVNASASEPEVATTVVAPAVVSQEKVVAFTYTSEASFAFEPTYDNFVLNSDAMLEVKITGIGDAVMLSNGNVYTAYTAEVIDVLSGSTESTTVTLYVDGGYLSVADYIDQARVLAPTSLEKSGLLEIPTAKQNEYIHFTSEAQATLTQGETYVVAANKLGSENGYIVPTLGYGVFESVSGSTFANVVSDEIINTDE